MSAALASISRVARGTVAGRPSIGVNDIDLSELVELRAAHETLQARNGVCDSTQAAKNTNDTCPVDKLSDFMEARKEIVQKFHQIL